MMVIFEISSSVEYLAGIEDAVGIERELDAAHQIDRAAKLLFEEGHLALPDAVFARAGAVHGERPRIQARDECLRGCYPLRRLVVEEQQRVEIAVACMADDRREQPVLLDIGLR